jgi:probable HAF family extracellular repeat protein
MRTIVFAMGLLLFLGMPCVAGASQYTITDMGAYSGSGLGVQINNQGRVAGTVPGGGVEPFVRSAAQTDFQGLRKSYGINNAGQSVGYMIVNGRAQAAISDGYLAVGIGSFGGSSVAHSINDDGLVVGYGTTTDGYSRAFRYEEGSMVALSTLGGDFSAAYDINRTGVITGAASTDDGSTHAFIYADGIMTDIGHLGGDYSYGKSINLHGEVIGYSTTTDGATHAFLYDPDKGGGLMDLGTFGGEASYALGINDYGDAVGYAQTATGDYSAFLYRDEELLDLMAFLPVDAGWDALVQAFDINNQGDILGYGIKDGERHLFLLSATAVPVPAAVWLLGSGLLGIILVRRRRS